MKHHFQEYEATLPTDTPLGYVIRANLRRRHLTAEQKRDIIAKLLKAQPEKCNRQIAKTAKVDHKTVGAARAELEATGEIPRLGKTIGADGKARKQPKQRDFKKERRAREERKLAARDGSIIDRLREELRTAEIKIAGLRSEIEELKAERDELRERFARFQKTAASANQALDALALEVVEHGISTDEAKARALEIWKFFADEVAKTRTDDGLDIPECLRRSAQ